MGRSFANLICLLRTCVADLKMIIFATQTKNSHLLYLLGWFLLHNVSFPIMAANAQIMSAVQTMYMPVWMTNIMVKSLVVIFDMVEATMLVVTLNIVIVVLSDALLEVMAMPDSKS